MSAYGGKKSVLIFSCSGAADVGALADQVARKLSKDGTGKMYCMAAVGANIAEKIAPVKEVTETVTIDGCASLCAKKVLENAGFTPKSFMLEDFGYHKGKTEVTTEVIIDASAKIVF